MSKYDSDKKRVNKFLNRLFKPDIRIIVSDDQSIIMGCMALTKNGADYLLHNTVLEKSYDNINFNGLCIESIEKST
jgi:hypothetical protein